MIERQSSKKEGDLIHYLQNIETDVDRFIDDFMGGQFGNEHDQEFLRSKFRSGYCYYFAHMLQLAFGRGLVCWTAPFGHFVWLDTDKKANEITVNEVLNTNAYDIEGRYRIKDTEAFYLIPEKYLTKKHISEFLHTEPQYEPTTKDDLIKIVKEYCKATGVPYDDNIEYWFTDQLKESDNLCPKSECMNTISQVKSTAEYKEEEEFDYENYER